MQHNKMNRARAPASFGPTCPWPHLRYICRHAGHPEIIQSPRTVRLKTLVGLRWFAVIGQAIAVLVVHYGLEFELPLAACLSVIALSAWLNVAMRMHFRNVQRLPPRPVALLLGYDIAQLTMLMALTGGIENPFAFLILAPVLIAAISLPLRYTLPLGVFAAACSTVIAFYFWPLPWTTNEQLVLPPLYILAIWVANLVAIVFIGAYAWQVAEEGRLMADALTATELVLAREQHLSQLDGLAAAAAHELGTPLVHHHGGGEGVAERARPGFAARRRREAVARAGAALPRDPRQALRAAGRRHAVPAREALGADRRGGRRRIAISASRSTSCCRRERAASR